MRGLFLIRLYIIFLSLKSYYMHKKVFNNLMNRFFKTNYKLFTNTVKIYL